MYDPELIKYAEVACILGVSVYTVRKYVKLGELCPIRLGRNIVRFDKREVKQFLKTRKSCKPKAK